MRIEIQLQADAALELHHQQAGENKDVLESQSGQLKSEVEQLGFKLEPVHPGQTHPLLTPYFMIEVPDAQTAGKVIEQLTKNKLVESAYISPEQSPPEDI